MTTPPRFERDLAAFFDAETSAPPADLLSGTLTRIEAVRQRPALLTHERYAGHATRLAGLGSLTPIVLVLTLAVSGLAIGLHQSIPGSRTTFATTTTGSWQTTPGVAFVAQVGRIADVPAFKWRAGAYSTYTGSGWTWGEFEREPLAQGQPLVDVSREAAQPAPDGRQRLELTVWPASFQDRTILSPGTIESVDRSTDAIVVGTAGWLASVEAEPAVEQYRVTALVPRFGSGSDAIGEERLRSAGTDYPADLSSIYTALPEGAIGPAASALLEGIRAQVRVPVGADAMNPYDLARTVETYLRSDAFEYREDVRALVAADCPSDISTVECFARIRAGYCEYYASTMAVLLRASGVPARIAYGFLPGQRNADGVEVVNGAAMFWWVEVYFPGSGWIEFDPTGGGRGQPSAIPTG
jgi:transglutaminase-like putative cysteine protease